MTAPQQHMIPDRNSYSNTIDNIYIWQLHHMTCESAHAINERSLRGDCRSRRAF
jgi:hypothetical protein